MLENKLQSILAEIRSERGDFKAKYEIVRNQFQGNEGSLVESGTFEGGVRDLTFLCTLPKEERYLLTYPVIGNWVLEQMEQFNLQTQHQKKVYDIMRRLVSERRFSNHHMRSAYENVAYYTKLQHDLFSAMMINPEESLEVHEFMCGIWKKFCDVEGQLELPKRQHTIDTGHGLRSPVEYLTHSIAALFKVVVDHKFTQPSELTIMVVDNENPEEWYQRLLAAGFQARGSQQGWFYDCESALVALEKGDYDVILTDIELGEGKMDGIEFVEKAYDIQTQKGKKPLIDVFSYDDKKLEKAEERLCGYASDTDKVISQPVSNNKIYFTAINFRIGVECAIKYRGS